MLKQPITTCSVSWRQAAEYSILLAYVVSEVLGCLDTHRTHLELKVLILGRLSHCSIAVGGCP